MSEYKDYLVCTICKRECHFLHFEGRVCNLHLGGSFYCQGILEKEKVEVAFDITEQPFLRCDLCDRKCYLLDRKGTLCDVLDTNHHRCPGRIREVPIEQTS